MAPAAVRVVVDPQPFIEFAEFVAETGSSYTGHNIAGDPRTYVPWSLLRGYWSDVAIHRVLCAFVPRLVVNIDRVRTHYLRIFSTLVYAGQFATRHFEDLFVKLDLDDGWWPSRECPLSWLQQLDRKGFLKDFFAKISPHQWQFFPLPFTRHYLQRKSIYPEWILPIEAPRPIARARVSSVELITIHEEYNHLAPRALHPAKRCFVLKTYHRNNSKTICDNKLATYDGLRLDIGNKPHPSNLVQFFGSFSQPDSCSLLYEYLDGGDLERFFSNTAPPTTSGDKALFWTSLFKVLKGLESIHNLQFMSRKHGYEVMKFGIHGEIQPEKILLMRGSSGSPYDFEPKIADLRSHGREVNEQLFDNDGDQRYSAPEQAGVVGQITASTDIFSFATVLSDTATWVIGGLGEQMSYFNTRKAYHGLNVPEFRETGFAGCFHDGFAALPIVAQQHIMLKEQCQPLDKITPFVLDLVEKDMLIASTADRLGASEALGKFQQFMSRLSLHVDDGRASTNHDSGYGTGSKAGTTTDSHTPVRLDTDFDDIASVMTDNLPLGLSERAQNAYVSEFVHQILEAARRASYQDPQKSELIRMLPDLLRSFALRVAFAEATEEGRAVGIFTRQNKDRITKALRESLQPEVSRDDGAADDGSITSLAARLATANSVAAAYTGEPEMTFQEKVQEWSLADMDLDDKSESGESGDDKSDIEQDSYESLDNNLDDLSANYLDDVPDGKSDKNSDDNSNVAVEPVMDELDAARIKFAVNTTSFSWLLKVAMSRSRLDYSTADVLDSIQELASASMGRHRGNRALRSHQVEIRMAWDPRAFVQQQGLAGAHSLLTCITITGTAEKPQLLVCRDYLNQVWPVTGEAVLEAVAALVADDSTGHVARSLFDGLQLSLRLVDGGLQAECAGLFDSIVEVVQILAWLGSALRESSGPEIRCGTTHIRMDDKAPQRDSSVQFLLNFSDEKISSPHTAGPLDSGCWLTGILNNPVVARGFPTLLRPADAMGLETPLGIMALLVDTPFLTIFSNRAMLKGFNAAVFPTSYAESHVQWHFILNMDASRLRYSDERMTRSPECVAAQMTASMGTSRHFLGWTSATMYNIGSPFANYDIGWSSPEFVGPGCALEKIIISGGPGFLSVGAECSVGRKDKSPVIKRYTGYFESLGGLSSAYIVLYDIRDHRAWLSNGVHTLLHLIRASLREDQKGDFSDECLLNHLDLGEVAGMEATSPKAAIRFFKNRRNLEQPVFPGLDEVHTEHTTVVGGQTTTTHYRTNTTVRLKDRVSQIMEVLWQLIDHQATLEIPAVPIRLPRNKLEGYRFMEVATRRAMTPRVVYLDTFNGAGKSWVDFTRALRAVVLFGEGFGDLLSAKQTATSGASSCTRWNTVPTGRDYLAVGGHDLTRILLQEGSAESNPLKLAPGVYWTPSTSAFECTCNSHSGLVPRLQRRCDRVQILLPGKLARTLNPSKPAALQTPLNADCALIFGKSNTFPWKWPDLGDPKPEDFSENTASSGNLPSDTSSSRLSSFSPSTSGQSQVTSSVATSATTPTTAMSSQNNTQDTPGNQVTPSMTETEQAAFKSKKGLRKVWTSLTRR
ncbi:hypothetical protein B0T16DRAFT_392934 [Cercophora newfieldiana]|uniref:Protein kinase domain-containing protein n=1 Tax=Cercophora newfieldiana TaxID=92897 RepID=A0AA40CMP1_9PEZI|nr:hypothetical protein B0T16DRAFT_392934 [Cercophora newfieldiana]